ncbi:hypothetical protein HZB89_00625 [archaeon]|nr:hypothetical protein [archaeon]
MPEMQLNQQQVIQMFQGEQAKLEVIERNRQALQNILREQVFAIETLKEVMKTKEKESLMVPLGAGVYLDVLLKNNSEAKASITADLIINEKIPKIIEKLEARKQDTIEKDKRLIEEHERVFQNIKAIESALQQASRKKA